MPAANESEEISHLIRDKGYPQKRAVAAALSMKRAGKFKKGKRKKKRRS
jgi:hypothetical protein